MLYNFEIHPAAQAEYEESIVWYLERSETVAKLFVKTAEKGVSDICADPSRNINPYKSYRALHLRRFPFTIIYSFNEETSTVLIMAIYHQKRHPKGKFR